MTDSGNLPSLTGSDALAMERELHAQSFTDFIRDSWHTLHSPEQPYVHNWHVDAIADHLMAVHRGEITRLLINVPYGASKSLLSTVLFPSWEWGPGQRPHLSYMCASYEMERLGKRDLGRMRSLTGSEWYQQRYSDQVQIDPKNDTKEKFHNQAGGYRETRPIGGMTGGRADRVIIDDPHSTEGAESEAERERTLRIFSESIPSRLNKPRESAIIVIMQRLHERDVSGHILEQELGYSHLCIPMRFEKDHPYPSRTVLGWTDPRSEEGELMFPDRFPESVVASDEQAFGGPHSYAAAGQLQQRPEPRGGGLIRVDKIERHSTAPMPGTIRSLVRYWDKAGTRGGGAYTAGVLMARLIDGFTPAYVVLDVVRGQWSAGERDRRMKETAELDEERWGRVQIYIEQEPGSGGKDSYQATAQQLPGFEVWPDRVTGDKTSRAGGFASQVEAGNVAVLDNRPWTLPLLNELEKFPNGRYKDQGDATAGAFTKLTATGFAGAWGSRKGKRRR